MKRISICFFFVFVTSGLSGCNPAPPADTTNSANRIDLLVKGDYIVTMDGSGTVIENGAVAIDEGVIIAVGKAAEIEADYPADETLSGSGRVVMPGLINGHTHAAMTLLRGLADDLALMDWLENYIFPAEVEFVDPEFVRIGTELACWEYIRGGTTTIVDMYYFPDTIAEVIDRCGIRALISATVIDQRSPDAENADDSLSKGVGFVERWLGRNSRITPIFGPHASYTLNKEQLAATRAAAVELGVPISIHVSESPFEVQNSLERFGMTSIEMYLKENTIHAEIMFLVALTAVARKVVILDAKSIDYMTVFAIAALVIALAAGYYLIKRSNAPGAK